jgi:hypothetical protein
MKTSIALILIAACGGGGGSSADGGGSGSNIPPADARVFLDAPPVVAAMITISGSALDSGASTSMPLAGVAISLLKTSDDSVLATATSGADGKYSLPVTTNGQVVDAYITATKSGYAPAATFPAAPFQADTSTADSNLVTSGNYTALKIFSGQTPGMGFVVAAILDANQMPVQGATASSTPAATYKYMQNNVPSGTVSTDTDGAAFYVNLPPGMVTISATKSGATFKSHAIKALADTFTSSVITE